MSFQLVILFFGLVRTMPVEQFYPFGRQAGDILTSVEDDGGSPAIKIYTRFPYFNQQHDQIFVSNNGILSFLQRIDIYTPEPFPLVGKNWSIIAPFWADVDLRIGGNVWYRQSTNHIVLQKATDDIRRYFPSYTRFRAAWVFVATWEEVPFYGVTSVSSPRNTFQVVLITNGRHSFTIFNFHKIQWTTGTVDKGNPETGLGGTAAQVGFNAGDGKAYYSHYAPGTATIHLHALPEQSNIRVPGRFAFRTDAETIHDGGCNTGGSLIVTPRNLNMLGGEKLTLSGPCFEMHNTVYAFLGRRWLVCKTEDDFTASCVTPMFQHIGSKSMEVQIVTGDIETSRYRGIYTAVSPARVRPTIIRVSAAEWTGNGKRHIEWNPDEIYFSKNNTRIDLFGLEEISGILSWKLLDSLGRDVDVWQGRHSFIQRKLLTHQTVVIRMSPDEKNIDHTTKEAVWSDVYPVIPGDSKLSKQWCVKWLEREQHLRSFDTNVQPCPCNLQQARLDTARFLPYDLCRLQLNGEMKSCGHGRSNSTGCTNCRLRPEAHHCVRLANPRPDGAGSLCCYDKRGTLLDARDITGGGTLYRYHDRSVERGNVPFASNFQYDIVPFIHCCGLGTSDQRGKGTEECRRFFEMRPPSKCKGYVPPRTAAGIGDPHFQTLDGVNFTFNGLGEFVLMKDKSFEVQVRMEEFKRKDPGQAASVFTAIAARAHVKRPQHRFSTTPSRMPRTATPDLTDEASSFTPSKETITSLSPSHSSHTVASATSHTVASSTSRRDASSTSHRNASSTSHRDASSTSHRDVSSTSHTVASSTSHRDVSSTSHRDVSSTPHRDASSTSHRDASSTSHAVASSTSHTVASSTSHTVESKFESSTSHTVEFSAMSSHDVDNYLLDSKDNSNTSDLVEVRLNNIRMLDIVVNGVTMDTCDENTDHWIDLDGVAISAATSGDRKEVHISFSDSVSMQIFGNRQQMHFIVVTTTDVLRGGVVGLLGNNNGNTEDDFVARDGSIIGRQTGIEDIHTRFGMTWLTSEEESLFTYPSGKKHASYQNTSFRPLFTLPNDIPERVKEECDWDQECIYDYITTGSRDLALDTKNFNSKYRMVKKTAKPAPSCGFPPDVLNGHWNVSGYLEGDVGRFVCDGECLQIKLNSIICREDGNWRNHTELHTGFSLSGDPITLTVIVPVVATTVLLLIIIGIVVIIVCGKRRKSKMIVQHPGTVLFSSRTSILSREDRMSIENPAYGGNEVSECDVTIGSGTSATESRFTGAGRHDGSPQYHGLSSFSSPS